MEDRTSHSVTELKQTAAKDAAKSSETKDTKDQSATNKPVEVKRESSVIGAQVTVASLNVAEIKC